jgi:streptogramin lyase
VDNPNRNDCLNYPFVGNIVEDKDGCLWICTEGGGLHRLDRKTQTFHYFVSEDKNGPPHNNLKSISYDEKRDMLYIGTYTGGLTKFHISTRRFHHYLKHSNGSSSPRPNKIINHTQIYNDNLYVSA